MAGAQKPSLHLFKGLFVLNKRGESFYYSCIFIVTISRDEVGEFPSMFYGALSRLQASPVS